MGWTLDSEPYHLDPLAHGKEWQLNAVIARHSELVMEGYPCTHTGQQTWQSFCETHTISQSQPERGHWLQPSPHHAPQELYTTSMCITHHTSHITTLHTTPQTQKVLV